jgi:uncharacterized protein YndB with AHSA1/START domain
MAHPFELTNEIQVDATPDEVWEAIATGTGMDAWFMGSNEIESREGGFARTEGLSGWTVESTVTTWDPPNRFIYGFDGTVVLGHHLYSDVDGEQAQRAWGSRLTGLFA